MTQAGMNRQHQREERKEHILRAAASVFARKGLAETKIADIAAEAGISHGLAYRYFSSKEEVFATLVEQAMNEAIHLAKMALEQPGTPWDRLHWLTEQVLPKGLASSLPAYSLVVLHALTNEHIPPSVREMAARMGAITQEAVCRLITDGQAADQMMAGNPEQLALLYWACIQGLVVGTMTPKMGETPFPDTDTVLSLFKG